MRIDEASFNNRYRTKVSRPNIKSSTSFISQTVKALGKEASGLMNQQYKIEQMNEANDIEMSAEDLLSDAVAKDKQTMSNMDHRGMIAQDVVGDDNGREPSTEFIDSSVLLSSTDDELSNFLGGINNPNLKAKIARRFENYRDKRAANFAKIKQQKQLQFTVDNVTDASELLSEKLQAGTATVDDLALRNQTMLTLKSIAPDEYKEIKRTSDYDIAKGAIEGLADLRNTNKDKLKTAKGLIARVENKADKLKLEGILVNAISRGEKKAAKVAKARINEFVEQAKTNPNSVRTNLQTFQDTMTSLTTRGVETQKGETVTSRVDDAAKMLGSYAAASNTEDLRSVTKNLKLGKFFKENESQILSKSLDYKEKYKRAIRQNINNDPVQFLNNDDRFFSQERYLSMGRGSEGVDNILDFTTRNGFNTQTVSNSERARLNKLTKTSDYQSMYREVMSNNNNYGENKYNTAYDLSRTIGNTKGAGTPFYFSTLASGTDSRFLSEQDKEMSIALLKAQSDRNRNEDFIGNKKKDLHEEIHKGFAEFSNDRHSMFYKQGLIENAYNLAMTYVKDPEKDIKSAATRAIENMKESFHVSEVSDVVVPNALLRKSNLDPFALDNLLKNSKSKIVNKVFGDKFDISDTVLAKSNLLKNIYLREGLSGILNDAIEFKSDPRNPEMLDAYFISESGNKVKLSMQSKLDVPLEREKRSVSISLSDLKELSDDLYFDRDTFAESIRERDFRTGRDY